MSASLVGSEMCIRDRRPPLQHSQIQRKRGAEARRHRDAGTHAHACRCLLYTSDAADICSV
eukprot:10469908-Alexandrium_andersonii.AAC.1